ncbi:FG-GAP repeat domain-containing protein, partial [Streptomyces sp. URMC 123]|uniref:FG-GAP repeat domain-containing protein n=1 Tax=Streptomyces sp. URMC 123 TaxID=3423403 RepID=UPI003F1E3012
MAKLSGRKRGRALTRIATAVLAATLVGATAGTAMADGTQPAAQGIESGAMPQSAPSSTIEAVATGSAPVFPLFGVEPSGNVYVYGPNGKGGLTDREYVDEGWQDITAAANLDQNKDGESDALYFWDNAGGLHYQTDEYKYIGGGWTIYNKVLAPGQLGGGQASDIIARDKSGVLWIYLGYGDGTVTGRVKVGAGWEIYNQIAGQGDLTGDGRTDIVARDGSGVLWLYKGTGDYRAPFAPRVKIGAGWNIFNNLVSTGDVNVDGRSDLIARGTDGTLWLYKGTGNAAAPFEPRVNIGTGG